MEKFEIANKNRHVILALGAESAGNFSVFQNGTIYFSQDFGDLLIEENFHKYTHELNKFLKNNKIKPDVILSDLHPEFNTTLFAQELAKKYKAQYFPVQHHLAHIFSAIGDQIIEHGAWSMEHEIIGVACDGTGFGFDEKIWGGEIFKISNSQFLISNQFPSSNLQIPKKNTRIKIERIAHLENQILLGGEMAIREPARILISILAKIYPLSHVIPGSTRNPGSSHHKNNEIYKYLKKYYSKNEFGVLWNQLEQNFNCLETSSTARILDAVSVLLGFSKNQRLSKHGPVELLEKNSTLPYDNLKPKIANYKLEITNSEQITNSNSKSPVGGQASNEMLVLNTTYLFEYLIKNLHKDKRRLAATAQKYIADGLLQIINSCHSRVGGNPEHGMTLSAKSWIPDSSRGGHGKTWNDTMEVFFAGGMANNKIISSILESKGVYTNKKIPRGDAGLSFGQIFFYLLAK